MKQKIFSLLLMISAVMLFDACQHPDGKIEWPQDLETQWLVFHETQCADPWGYGNSQPDKAKYVKAYLEKQGIEVLYISLTRENDGAACMACNCPSGRVFKVQVKKIDTEKLVKLGFKLI